jgi:hypothetical protein
MGQPVDRYAAVVDGATNYIPCFQLSPLDCFQEGVISVIGEERGRLFSQTVLTSRSHKPFS